MITKPRRKTTKTMSLPKETVDLIIAASKREGIPQNEVVAKAISMYVSKNLGAHDMLVAAIASPESATCKMVDEQTKVIKAQFDALWDKIVELHK